MLTSKSLAIGFVASALALGALSLPAMARGGDCPVPAGAAMMKKGDPISKDAFMAMHQQRFEQMDTNKDGILSKDEMAAHRKAMKDCRDQNRADRGMDGKRNGGGPGPQNGTPQAQ